MMTVKELLNSTAAALAAGGIAREDAAFEARCLVEDLAGIGRGRLEAAAGLPVAPAHIAAVERAVRERIGGRPLQYILGEWDFLRLRLAVGEGVLIPRPETELLCETAVKWLAGRQVRRPRVLDLCAGSGCVGLGIASLYPGATGRDDLQVTLIEKSPEALAYLRRNAARYPEGDTTVIPADILTADPARFGEYDLLVSNPPYIPASELPDLMPEVRREPAMALDGGEDGLLFYRAIAGRWLPALKPGGCCAVEVGAGQAEAVMALMAPALTAISAVKDYSGIDRVVYGVV
ncbi:MAG: peptide chain release factor N(5)-glutamine methyltransferase [Oscillospiraceae bacterium]|nr:peptide chain release factor N(5)-glutamine methyltransferase [Oscillospiraceae bacterium]